MEPVSTRKCVTSNYVQLNLVLMNWPAFAFKSYPEQPHWQFVGLTLRRSRVLVPLTAASLMICSPHLHYASGARGVLQCEVYGSASQLNLSFLTPLVVAGCGRVQLGAAHWATSVALLQVVDN